MIEKKYATVRYCLLQWTGNIQSSHENKIHTGAAMAWTILAFWISQWKDADFLMKCYKAFPFLHGILVYCAREPPQPLQKEYDDNHDDVLEV